MKKTNKDILLKKNDHSTLDTIGSRIRYLRKLTGLDRPAVEKRHHFKVPTLEKWENNRVNIGPKNLTRLISMALDHSIVCTQEWLISGEGPPPKTIPPSLINTQQEGTGNSTEDILRDLSYFRNTYPKGITLMVSDDSMAPTYVTGDFVGGNTFELTDLKKCLDFACIIHTADGKKRLRRVGYKNGTWFLYGTNTRHKGAAFLEIDPEITKVAPIFWHRMKL